VDFMTTEPADTCPPGSSVKPPDGARTATIRGRVTGASGEPLACARVSIMNSDVLMPAVFTDPQGRYSIEGLPAGPVILEARKLGYISLQYGQRRPSDAETTITLQQQELRSGVDIVLPRGSMVSGTVVDEHGEPVEGISISAFQLGRLESWTTVRSSTLPRTTDDRGHYRLTGLDPGTYLVAATVKSGVSSTGTTESRAYTTTYYPGTSDVLTSQRIVLDAGRNADGIDIPFAPRAPRPCRARCSTRTAGRSRAAWC
jgi:protocatechuate 3,4-dioxygenase beta subunit